jgi:hypothetical protein
MPCPDAGVKFSGKCWSMPGMSKPKHTAGFESLEVKLEGENSMIFKFRTSLDPSSY